MSVPPHVQRAYDFHLRVDRWATREKRKAIREWNVNRLELVHSMERVASRDYSDAVLEWAGERGRVREA